MAAKEKGAQGRRGFIAEPVYIGMSVEVTTHEAVDAVADFLEANGDGVVHRFKFAADNPRGRVGSVVSGYVDIELVPLIAAMDGVKRIKQNHPAVPDAYNRQSGGPVTDLLLPSRTGSLVRCERRVWGCLDLRSSSFSGTPGVGCSS